MRIKSFKIENFRNLHFVECIDVPNLMVISGPNGCGKSALLEALNIAKNAVSSYSGGDLFSNIQSHLVSAGKKKSNISLTLEFSDAEILHYEGKYPESFPKEYEIIVKERITDGQLKKLSEGVKLFGKRTKETKIKRISSNKFNIVLTEGKNRQIRRICRKVGNPVISLKRIRIANLKLTNLFK